MSVMSKAGAKRGNSAVKAITNSTTASSIIGGESNFKRKGSFKKKNNDLNI